MEILRKEQDRILIETKAVKRSETVKQYVHLQTQGHLLDLKVTTCALSAQIPCNAQTLLLFISNQFCSIFWPEPVIIMTFYSSDC